MLLNASLCARTVEAKQTETLEFGIEKGLLQGHPSKENGWLMPKKPWTPQWFGGESFYRPNLGRELQGVWLLISWWWGERTVCIRNLELSLKLPFSIWVGGLSSCIRTQSYLYVYPFRRNQDLPQGCTIVSWLLLPYLCIPSLPWLATVWTCPLELREGHGGWMKPISYKQGMRDTERICTQEGPTGSCSVSIANYQKLPKDPK